jgi:hypothetical protein
MEDSGSPINNCAVFDILGARRGGGVDAVVVCSAPLDGSQATLRSLSLKIRSYLHEMASDNFVRQFGTGPTRIFVSCSYAISPEAKQRITDLALEAARQDVLLLLGEPVA